MANGRFIAYYRVSTKGQGESGLGLEGQRGDVTGYLNGGRWELVQEVIEIESGKKNDRPKLAEALRLCRIYNAKLLVAKLDRLARNVAFISALMEAGVKFVACDMPDANDMTIHILASVAQGEAKAISDRTRTALQAAKERGTRLGGLRKNSADIHALGNAKSVKVRHAKAVKRANDLLLIVEQAKSEGATTLREIAAFFNTKNVETPRGGPWSAVQVQRIITRAA